MSKVLCILDKETNEVQELSGIDLLNGFSALKKITIKDAVQKYLDLCTSAKSEKQQQIETKFFKVFLTFVKDKTYIHEIKSDDVHLFRSELIKTMQPISAVRRLTTINHLFNKCIDWEYIYKNPFKSVEKLKIEKKHYKPWTIEEFKNFIETVNGDFNSIFKFLWLTGCRPSELINLKWTDVDYERKLVKFICGKNKNKSRYFPMSDEVDRLLHSLPFKGNSVFTIEGRAFKNDNIYQSCKHRLKILGLNNLTVYGIRHSFASRMSDNGLNAFEIQYLMGHSDIKTTLNYIHENKKLLIEKMNRVNSLNAIITKS